MKSNEHCSQVYNSLPMPDLAEIRARLEACPIPEGATTDWDGTRHLEIYNPNKPPGTWWWLDLDDWVFLSNMKGKLDPQVESRCGAVLDYACAYRGDVAALLAEIDRLTRQLSEIEQQAARATDRAIKAERELGGGPHA